MKKLRENLLNVKKGDKINYVNGGQCGPDCKSSCFEVESGPTMTIGEPSGLFVIDEKEFQHFLGTGHVGASVKITCSACRETNFVSLEHLNKIKQHLEIYTE